VSAWGRARARCGGLGDRLGRENVVADAAEHEASDAVGCADRDLEQQLRAERKADGIECARRHVAQHAAGQVGVARGLWAAEGVP
jgi:hypothetical protein